MSDTFQPRRRLTAETVTLAHGGGGRAMRDLIEDVFASAFGTTGAMEDQARIALGEGTLAFTTDSYVVSPIFFPGGDIGDLAVNGTVNDLAVGGAIPLALSCAVIIEEGTRVDTLRRIATSMRQAADAAGVSIVTGDTKVVGRGAADTLFVTTSGVGRIPPGRNLSASNIRPGDVVLVNGTLGDHGAAILNARGDMALESEISSDTAPLAALMEAVIAAAPGVRCARDATRGGLASVLNEFADAANVGITLTETAVPLRAEVRGMCEILGFDPLYLANEGRLVVVVPPGEAGTALAAMRNAPHGEGSTIVGRVTDEDRGTVVMETLFGGARIVDMLVGEQLPRIC